MRRDREERESERERETVQCKKREREGRENQEGEKQKVTEREKEGERQHLQLENLGSEPVTREIVIGVHDDHLGAGQVAPVELLYHLGQGVDHGANVELLQPSLRRGPKL